MSLSFAQFTGDARWETSAVVLIGLVCAALVLLLGRLFTRTPRPAPLPPTAAPPVPGTAPGTGLAVFDGVDRRGNPRLGGAVRQILLTDPDLRDDVEYGQILDRSLGGLGLELSREVTVGERFRVRPLLAPPEAPWVLVEVRYCRRRGEQYRVGCQFLEASSWDLMSLFGPKDPDE